MKSYRFLEQLFSKINNVDCILKRINQPPYDQVEQVVVLEEIKHEMISHDLVKEMLEDALNNKKKLNEWQKSNLGHMSKLHKHNSILPAQLVQQLTETKFQCKGLWNVAHQEGDFSNLLPSFTKLVELIREATTIKSDSFQCSKYDALLDFYDSDIREEDLDKMFTEIGDFFRKYMDEIIQEQSKKKIFHIKNAPIEKQKLLNNFYLDAIGLSKTTDDYSMDNTINYDKSNFCSSLFAYLRGSGCMLYEKHLPQDQQISKVEGQIIYESHSMLIERNLGTSQEFVDFIQPSIKKFLSTGERATSAENIYHLLNKVHPSPFLRDADEVTFLAHIMLRYALEKEIILGDLQIKDLHDAWLQGTKHYFNCAPKKESEEYFQDDYWINGIFGYFPLKAVAATIATQIFSVIKDKNYEVLTNISKGDFNPLINWLNSNIYNHGAKYTSIELLKKITNKGLNVDCHKDYLLNKFLRV